jgi:esterase/lipase superfamily enzyme
MTRFITTRTHDVGGSSTKAEAVESADVAKPTYLKIADAIVDADTAGKHVILAVHGFNVSRPKGVRSLARLERQLQLTADQVFFGVLWPGDFWLPVVNYPAEASDAAASGIYLAQYINTWMTHALSLSFISHSLGGRVLLEAVQGLARPAREVVVTAGAVDDNCLAGQYASVKAKAGRLSVLSSAKDKVLGLAYPLGDFASDVFWGDKDSPWHGALGLHGPKPAETFPGVTPRQIPDSPAYGHGDYFPPSDPAAPKPNGLWERSVRYMRRAINGDGDAWV